KPKWSGLPPNSSQTGERSFTEREKGRDRGGRAGRQPVCVCVRSRNRCRIRSSRPPPPLPSGSGASRETRAPNPNHRLIPAHHRPPRVAALPPHARSAARTAAAEAEARAGLDPMRAPLLLW
uniref:Uncharacterized protein n=1 Tax=Aegilops tauschii subsp. strangulata TaxID=200361 RepID=A0A453AUA2_AEGTS